LFFPLYNKQIKGEGMKAI